LTRLDESRLGGFLFPSHVAQWVMHPNGTPRGDRELAAEVLVEIWTPTRTHGCTRRHALNVADVLKLDSAAAIVVSTFLAALPRVTGRYGQGATCFVTILVFRAKNSPERSRVPQQWREV
jgi:hypothetical protein